MDLKERERQVMAWVPWSLANRLDDYISDKQREEREKGPQITTKKSVIVEALEAFLYEPEEN